MMKQYMEIKEKHQDALLMFRLGDFYELFEEDAKTASKELEITLTGRAGGAQGRIPMCGVPFHSAAQYIARLNEKGYSVAICEQTEDPQQAKGLVKREVVRVITPGTALPDVGTGNRYMASLIVRNGLIGLSFLDVGTGEVYTDEFSEEKEAREQFASWQPVEILTYDSLDSEQQLPLLLQWSREHQIPVTIRSEARQQPAKMQQVVLSQYHVSTLLPLDLDKSPAAAEALGLALQYIRDTQKVDLAHLRQPARVRQQQAMHLDYTALANLEVLETVRTRKQNSSLYGLLHRTKTAMGSRLLRKWLERPLKDVKAIEARLDAVEVLVNDLFLRNHLQEALANVYDLERLAGRVAFGSANARDLLAVSRSLLQLPELTDVLSQRPEKLFSDLTSRMPDLTALAKEIEHTLVDEPPVSVRDGSLIRKGVNEELDALRELSGSGKTWLANLEQQERERTGIKSLKVGYNKVFGYYLEVSKANLHLVPDNYERRQTLSSAERYVLPELKEQEARILNAEDSSTALEYDLFTDLRNKVQCSLLQLQQAADVVAEIDILCAFASVSVEGGYTRPVLMEERGIEIRAGRHPVVEAQMRGQFVPNDVSLTSTRQMVLITGPNMAGKSTFMRQTALIVLMAHIGCFVPAESAQIGLVDRIFTRIGASDDLTAGQSTFMVEMVELAQVLRQGTNRSLVLLDEVGRGTSTYDGLCIAESVMETLSQPDSPLTLFATHYHELTETADTMNSVANASVLVQEEGDSISFLHTVVDRPADRSYGIQVAKLAGVPSHVIERAQDLLQKRENSASVLAARSATAVKETAVALNSVEPAATNSNSNFPASHTGMSQQGLLGLFPDTDLLDELAQIDVLKLTPIDAMNKLYEVVQRVKDVTGWDKSR
ncbi:DNA mismatch repair protein MutS [Alicyclobacillus sp. SO9]|nr:DNA mismatch repair protein MutS [Alicyclobacillus sp. SO9]